MYIRSVLGSFVVAMCMTGCGGGSSGGSSSSSGGGAPVGQSITVNVQDGDLTWSYQAVKGERFQYALDAANAAVDVKSISGCGLSDGSITYDLLGQRQLAWVASENCSLEINYDHSEAKGSFVDVVLEGYGSALGDWGVDLVYVEHGMSLSIPLGLKEGYQASGSGCGGNVVDGKFVTDTVVDDCTVHLFVSPVDAGSAVTIDVSYSEPSPLRGREQLRVVGSNSFELDTGNLLGHVPVVSGTCETDWLFEHQGIPDGIIEVFAPRDGCQIHFDYKPVSDATLVAYVEPSDAFRSYIATDYHGAGIRAGHELYLPPGGTGILKIIPNPGFSLVDVDGCKADNGDSPLDVRTAYFGSENHGVRDCAVRVEHSPSEILTTRDVAISYEWDRPDDMSKGNVLIPRMLSAWNVIDFKSIGVQHGAFPIQPNVPKVRPCQGIVMIDDTSFLLAPVTSSDALCVIELRKY